MKKINYKEKGITLVALVITIIILLILAGVTISTALGQNGLFQRAKYAGEQYKASEIEEDESLKEFEKEIDEINPKKEKVTITFNSNGGEGEMEKIIVDKGQEITLPKNKFTWNYHGFGKWNTDKEGKGKEYLNGSKITVDKDTELYAMWANYGTKMQEKYDEIYASFDSKNKVVGTSADNIREPSILYSIWLKCRENFINDSKGKEPEIREKYNKVIEGENNNKFIKEINNEWIIIDFHAWYSTTNVSLNEFKLIFKNDIDLTIKDAIDEEYIEPLVLCESPGRKGWYRTRRILLA